jgi:hypothetical protein
MHASGIQFEGEYINGERNGHGILRNKDGEVVYDGLWKNGSKVL